MMRRVSLGTTLGGSAMVMVLLLPSSVGAAGAQDEAGSKTQEESPSSGEVTPPSTRRGRIELRRQNSERGTADESTRTTIRLEANLAGMVSRLRLDLPFPDEKTDFAGDPFNPRPGDIKTRAYFRPFHLGDAKLSTDVEMTFPTANPAELGSGKYQFGAAIHSVPGAPDFISASGHHRLQIEWTVRHTVSIAGDAARKDINTTKPELALRDLLGSRHWLKLTFKPVIDWVQDGKTGAVLELEGGWNASRDWRFSLMGGARLWGEGVPGTYDHRVELVAGRAF